jgi:hypothetical protein
MQIRIILILLAFLFSSSGGTGQAAGSETVYSRSESLKYQMYYGLINAGEVTMTIEPSSFMGQEVLHAVTTGYTTGLADRLFKIYDVYESFMNPMTGLPVKAIRNIRESNYRYYNEVLYDRDSNIVKSQLSGIHEVPPGIMDMVSVIYKLRDTINTTLLRPGDTYEMNTFFSDKVYPVVIRYEGTETIRTRKGRFHALKFSPVTEPGRVFKSEDDISIWLSNDRNLVPLRVSLNMLLGSIRVDLIEADGLRHELLDLR